MDQLDIEEIIKEWPEEWRNPLEDLNYLEEDPEKKKEKEEEKGKGKENLGEKRKKEPAGEKRPASQEEKTSRKKFKQKVSIDPYDPNPMLNSSDYEGIATSMHESLEESMTAIVTSQDIMKVMIDQRIMELKTLLERTPQMLTTLAMSSTSRTPWGSSTSEGRTQFVCILPTSVRLPSGSPID